MRLILHRLLPAILCAGILSLSFPFTARGAQPATRDWKTPYSGDVTLSWDPLVPGSRSAAAFLMEAGSSVYLGDLAQTGVPGVSARQLSEDTYDSAFPKYVSVSKTTGLVKAKKPGASLVALHAAGQSLTALITVVPKGSCALTTDGKRFNNALIGCSRSFSGRLPASAAIKWYQKAIKAHELLDQLKEQKVNRLGFYKTGLLTFTGAPSASALYETMTAYVADSHPIRQSSSCRFLPEDLNANSKKNQLTLRVNSSVTKQQLLGLMTDPLTEGSPDSLTISSNRKTWSFSVLVYDQSNVNTFGEAKAYPARITVKCGSRLMTVRFTDPAARLIKGHHYLLSDPRLSEAESVGGWTLGADTVAR
ncbi:MAG: hypothetical protein IIU28_08230 [Lachnospiraceae bacterium]|nr:hypothetical protein [Lachnospiraceae bacterium]